MAANRVLTYAVAIRISYSWNFLELSCCTARIKWKKKNPQASQQSALEFLKFSSSPQNIIYQYSLQHLHATLMHWCSPKWRNNMITHWATDQEILILGLSVESSSLKIIWVGKTTSESTGHLSFPMWPEKSCFWMVSSSKKNLPSLWSILNREYIINLLPRRHYFPLPF